MLFLLHLAAQSQHRDVGYERQGRRVTGQLLVVLGRFAVVGNTGELAKTQAEHQAANRVAGRVADMGEQQVVEKGRCARRRCQCVAACISLSTYGWQRIAPWPKIIRLRVRMLAPSTVMETGNAFPGTAQVVAWPEDDALAAVDVHGVGDDFPCHLSGVVLGDGGRDSGFLAQVHGGGCHAGQGREVA